MSCWVIGIAMLSRVKTSLACEALNASRECSFISKTDNVWDTLRVNAYPTDSGVGHLRKRIEPGDLPEPRL